MIFFRSLRQKNPIPYNLYHEQAQTAVIKTFLTFHSSGWPRGIPISWLMKWSLCNLEVFHPLTQPTSGVWPLLKSKTLARAKICLLVESAQPLDRRMSFQTDSTQKRNRNHFEFCFVYVYNMYIHMSINVCVYIMYTVCIFDFSFTFSNSGRQFPSKKIGNPVLAEPRMQQHLVVKSNNPYVTCIACIWWRGHMICFCYFPTTRNSLPPAENRMSPRRSFASQIGSLRCGTQKTMQFCSSFFAPCFLPIPDLWLLASLEIFAALREGDAAVLNAAI